jgi:signal transduction histidine kinase
LKSLVYNRKLTILFSLLSLALILLMWIVSVRNYLLFHSVIEIAAIAIGFSTMLISIKTLEISENHFFNFLGIISGFSMIIILMHTLTFRGAGIFTTDSNIPTQLYIFYKYYELISLIIAFKFVSTKPNFNKIITINLIVIMSFLLIIFFTKLFPDCYNNSTGLTFFKIFSEYLFCFVYIVVVALLQNRTIKSNDNKIKLVSLSIVFKLLSSISFTMYIDVYGFLNFTGHIFNFISYCLFYNAMFKGVVIGPYSNLLNKVIQKTEELEAANEELKKSKLKIEKEYNSKEKLINFLPDGIVILENEKIVYCNKTYLNLFNIRNSYEVVGKSLYDIIDSSYHDILYKRLHVSDKNILLNPQIYEMKVNNKNFLSEVCSLYTSNNGVDQLIVCIRDISDRKRVEDMKFELLQKEREEDLKNEFFTNISHELKTPVNVIYSALQLQSIYSNKPELVSKYNDLMMKNALRLIRLTNNMIDITKVQANFFKPNMVIQNIVPVIENISLSIIDYLQFKDLNLVFDTEYEELYVRFDKSLLERILLNLLSNAIKYGRHHGSIYVNIYTEDADAVTISIKDDGIGMPLESQEKVFLRLQKLDNSLSRNNEGSGVGLFLVKSFTEIQQGTIEFTSKINEGSEFILKFPRIYEVDEVCATIDELDTSMFKETMEITDIEFSDIYN